MFRKKDYLEKLYYSDKPLIIYKSKHGYDVFTDFVEKIKLNDSNINQFFKKVQNQKENNKYFGYVGFFGHEILCSLIGLKTYKRNNNFPKGIFYKPKTVIHIRKGKEINNKIKNLNHSNFKVNLSLKKYTEIFNKCTKKIKKGETYQIKICQKYNKRCNIDSINFFWKLMSINSSPESFFIRDKDYSIISCSPETLIDKRKNKIITKPIAGTMKKNNHTTFLKAKHFFQKNKKESKEHNMIVDMERNDLSRVCKPGSVKITKLKYVEEYKDLYHYITEISGKLNERKTIKDIVKAMMPGGSVIGCPKMNTLKILNNFEKQNRNIYTGSFGYIKNNLDMRFNIIIRSILIYKDKCEISTASGVVIGSKAKKEYEENYIKAKALLGLFKK